MGIIGCCVKPRGELPPEEEDLEAFIKGIEDKEEPKIKIHEKNRARLYKIRSDMGALEKAEVILLKCDENGDKHLNKEQFKKAVKMYD